MKHYISVVVAAILFFVFHAGSPVLIASGRWSLKRAAILSWHQITWQVEIDD